MKLVILPPFPILVMVIVSVVALSSFCAVGVDQLEYRDGSKLVSNLFTLIYLCKAVVTIDSTTYCV